MDWTERIEQHMRTIHGGHGIGAVNEEGSKVLGRATAYQLRILNAIFQIGTNHLTTCSGGNKTEINYMI